MIGLDDIRAAAARIAPRIRRTPMIEAAPVHTPVTDGRLVLKLESLQVTGSFKARGATNRVLTLPPEALARGLVTASGGNHALAVAHAARVEGVGATVFLPATATAEKRARLAGMGARVEVVGTVFHEAQAAALAFADATGAAFLHPFADPMVVAGQGTVALELLEQVPDLDTVVIAIGGGGLIAGMATALRALRPGLRIVGVEPEGSPTLKASLDAGRVVRLDRVTSAVATMSCAETDPRVFDLVRRGVDEVVLVPDDAMRAAARWLWEEMGLAADLSGAAGVAALATGAARAEGVTATLVCGAGRDGLA